MDGISLRVPTQLVTINYVGVANGLTKLRVAVKMLAVRVVDFIQYRKEGATKVIRFPYRV